MNARPQPQTRFCQEVLRLNNQLVQKDLFDLLDLIQAPPSLQAFFVHITNLPYVFRAATTANISGLDGSRFRTAERTADALRTLLPDMLNNLKLRDLRPAVPTPRFGSCTGILETFPLYSFLAENVRHKEYRPQFILLQAQVLLAMESLGELEPEVRDSLLTPFRCLRDLSKMENLKYLGPLPVTAVSTTSYAMLIIAKFSRTKFQPIEHIFQTAEQAISRKEKSMSPTPTKKEAAPPDVPDISSKTAETYLGTTQPSTVLSRTEAEEYLKHGGLPEELGASVGFEAVLAPNTYHGPTLRQLAFQAKQASNRRALDNQFSAMAWNQLNQYDLKILLEFLEGDHVPDIDCDPLTLKETVALLGLIFFTGNSYVRVLSLPVFMNTIPNLTSPEGVYLTEQKKILVRLFSPGATLEGKTTPVGAIPVEPFIHIPVPEFLSGILSCVFGDDTSRPHLFRNIDPNNADSMKVTHTLLRRALGELSRGNGTRLSLGRISSYLLFRVAEGQKSDLPCAMLFFGRNDKIAHTRLHYTVASSRHLERVFRQSCNDLSGSLGRTWRFSLNESVNQETHLGTPLCPTHATVKTIARDLQKAVHGAAKSTLPHRHNLFALYTAMLIAFGTGFRAVQDPSFSEIEIDYDYGIGVISDKGNAPYRSRYVYLAPVVLEQIDHYRRHVQVIYSHFGVTNPSLFDMVKGLEFEGLPLNLFWFRNELSPVELLKPGVSKQILQKNHKYAMPLNCGRHYLKYRLLNAGCSPEIVEAQMGHWENGQEPWGRFSNLDPLEFAGQVASFLPKILQNDGWQALKGLG